MISRLGQKEEDKKDECEDEAEIKARHCPAAKRKFRFQQVGAGNIYSPILPDLQQHVASSASMRKEEEDEAATTTATQSSQLSRRS